VVHLGGLEGDCVGLLDRLARYRAVGNRRRGCGSAERPPRRVTEIDPGVVRCAARRGRIVRSRGSGWASYACRVAGITARLQRLMGSVTIATRSVLFTHS